MTDVDSPEEGTDSRVLADGFRDTDTGNSNRLIKVAGDEIRYVHAWRKWVVYEDGVWKVDPGGVLVTEKAKRVSRFLFRMAGQSTLDSSHRDELINWAKKSESAASIANMIKLGQGIPGVVVDHNELETKPELLNAQNGTVNLRTGELLPFNSDDLLIKQCNTIYDPLAECPLFLSCLERWQPDPLMRAYLQVCAGMACTGYPIEEFHVHHGGGANGKGKFWGALMDVLGPYAVIPDKSLLMVQKHEPHPTVWAHLFRARAAIGDETPEGGRLNEEKVKQLTGGDRIQGRRMHEDPWEYEPTHLLVVRTNHIPQIKSADEAMRRRYRLIPWSVTIPRHERDASLPERLREEAPGILNWAVKGSIVWLSNQRLMPRVEQVEEATNDMFRTADPLGYFLSIATIDGGDKSVTTKELHEAYLAWRSDPKHDDEPRYVDNAEIGNYVRDRGFRKSRVESNGSHAKGWRGLDLTDEYKAFVEWVRVNEPERLRDSGPNSFRFSWNPS